MLKGLMLGNLIYLPEQSQYEPTYKYGYTNVAQIGVAGGITHLANVVIYNLITRYDPVTGVGAIFKSIIGRNFGSTMGSTGTLETELTLEFINVENRIIQSQKNAPNFIPDESALLRLDLVSIDLDGSDRTGIVQFRIINKLGQLARIIVG